MQGQKRGGGGGEGGRVCPHRHRWGGGIRQGWPNSCILFLLINDMIVTEGDLRAGQVPGVAAGVTIDG